MHVQHFLFAEIAEFGVLRSFDVDEHHEDVGEEHVFFLFDSNLLSEIFSQDTHDTSSHITVISLVARVVPTDEVCVAQFDFFNSEQWT